MKLALETNTTLRFIDEATLVYDTQGSPVDKKKVASGCDMMWSILSDAFKYSNESCEEIAPSLSLKEFFEKKLAEKSLDSEDKDFIMLLAETWGGFIGDPWQRQSLKWFWLEECLDGGKF
jgi:hypothetical protein